MAEASEISYRLTRLDAFHQEIVLCAFRGARWRRLVLLLHEISFGTVRSVSREELSRENCARMLHGELPRDALCETL